MKFSRRAGLLGGLSLVGNATAAASGVSCVLVHGAWHGGWCWDEVRARLKPKWPQTFTPTLTGLADRSGLISPEVTLMTHVRDVIEVVEAHDLRDLILVGHSYAGLVITVAGAMLAHRVKRLVYLDAFVPAPGQTGFDLLNPKFAVHWKERAQKEGEGFKVPPMLDAKAMGVTDPKLAAQVDRQLTPQPLATFTTPCDFDADVVAKLPKTYVRCSKFSGFKPTMDRVKKAGWETREIDCGHDAMLAAPEQLAQLLLTLV